MVDIDSPVDGYKVVIPCSPQELPPSKPVALEVLSEASQRTYPPVDIDREREKLSDWLTSLRGGA